MVWNYIKFIWIPPLKLDRIKDPLVKLSPNINGINLMTNVVNDKALYNIFNGVSHAKFHRITCKHVKDV